MVYVLAVFFLGLCSNPIFICNNYPKVTDQDNLRTSIFQNQTMDIRCCFYCYIVFKTAKIKQAIATFYQTL